MVRAMNCDVYILVEHNPNSGPALTWLPHMVMRDTELPTTLVIPTVIARRRSQYWRARTISRSSPNCDTKTHTSDRWMTGVQ